jgi:N-sulfoglucosamine sulfohydrolase
MGTIFSDLLRSQGLLTLILVLPAFQTSAGQNPKEKPNILWIVSEDNCPYLGCYGDSFATTPNLDRLASKGFLYTHAYCNSPVCSPARNAIITGAYAASNGNEQMRSNYRKSETVHTYVEYLHEAGYYCTNNSKTDYNTSGIDPAKIWDESSTRAHYKNRPAGRPFFAVFNIMTSHESSIHHSIPTAQLRHDPAKVILPPYHPDTEEMRHDWAQYYDVVEDMDTRVGELLKELEESGEAENTIVFYYGDNGGVLARSKRYVYESGTHVPLIVSIPVQYKALYPVAGKGEKVGRLVSLLDLAPTLLSIIGIQVPEYMQGHAFLGKQKTSDPEYVFMTRGRMDERYDMSRAIRDKKYRYIRNYMPFRIYGQHLDYLFNAPSARSWETACKEGKCNAVQSVFWNTKPVEELYDMDNDPWEIHNLASDPAYGKTIARMQSALTGWMKDIKDAGLIPESDYGRYSGSKSMYDYMHADTCPLDDLINAANLATLGSSENIPDYIGYLGNRNSGIRYWGVTGLLIMKENARSAIPELKKAGSDKSSAVATLAAETLYGLGEKDAAIRIYSRILQDTLSFGMTDRNFALNSIDAVGDGSAAVIAVVQNLYNKRKAVLQGIARYNEYDALMSEWLLKKWGVLQQYAEAP